MITGTQLPESSTDPAAVANYVQLYAKDVAGVSQLFVRSDDGTISQVSGGGGGGMAIGGAITSATAGSVLFAGAAGVLQQDNANFFWDDTDNRLGVGTASPGSSLSFIGDLNSEFKRAGNSFIAITTVAASADAGVFLATAAINEDVALFLDESDARKFKIAVGTVGTDGDRNTNTRMTILQTGEVGIGTTAPTTKFHVVGDTNLVDGYLFSRRTHATDGTIFVRNNHVSNTGPSAIGFDSQAGVFKLYVGFFPSAYAFTHYQSKNGIFCFGGEDLVIGDGTNVTAQFNHTDNSLGIGIANAATVFTDCKLGVESTSGHSLVGIRTLVASSDAVLNFATLTSVSEDASIFLDETDARKFKFATGNVTTDALRLTNTRMVIQQDGRLGIGTTAPLTSYQLHIRRTVAGEGVLALQSTSATGFSTMNMFDEAGGFAVGLGHDNASNTAYIDNPSGNPFLISSLLTTTPALSVRNTSVTGYSGTQWLSNTSVAQGSLGYANASAGIAHIANKLYWHASTAIDIVFSNITRAEHTFGMVSGSSFHGLANGSGAAVSAASTGRLRYTTTGQKFQVSMNGGAYVDLATGSGAPSVEYLAVDGAADPAIDTTFVSGTGTDLTLANGTVGGFIKNFVITGGSGTIVPANLADGNTLTWTAAPANVSFVWDATNTTWHVIGNPYNMVTT